MSKIGCHVIFGTARAIAWASKASVVKQLDRTDALRVAPDSAIRIFRRYFPESEQDLRADPHQVATRILESLGGYRHPLLYVEVFNEVSHQPAAQIVLLQGVVPLLHAAGVKVCGPCWSTGAYDDWDWSAFRVAGWAGLDAIALHAYWGTQGFTPWHALRYRQWWRAGDPPILITECGRDTVEGGLGGWKRDGVSGEQYVGELAAYGAELARDSYVLGATVFTAGPTPDWNAFSTDELDISPLLAAPTPAEPDAPVPPVVTSEVWAEYRQYGKTWPEVAANLLGVCNDALATGRRLRDLGYEAIATWGSR